MGAHASLPPTLHAPPEGPPSSLAFVRLQPSSSCASDAWLRVAYDLTPRLERVSARSALLDLGVCSEREAREAAETLLAALAALGLDRRIGVGPSCAVAQLAVLAASASPASPASQSLTPITVITPEAAPTFLRALPVTLLPYLHPAGLVHAEDIARLRAYGLHTLGHLARLGERALARQFGAVGRFLAAVAAGRDAHPFCPTPRPATLQFRLRPPTTAASEAVVRALVPLAARVSRHLAQRAQRAALLRLILTWERGHVVSGEARLRTPTNEARLLAQQVQRLSSMLLFAERSADRHKSQCEGLAEVVLEVGELGPIMPAQTVLWRTEAQKREALAQAVETLARRAGGPQLFRPVCVADAAIFRADRYRLLPLAPDATPPAASAAVPPTEAGTPWDRVPQRLHWW